MQLKIQPTVTTPGNYDLIETTDSSQLCLLEDTLANCLTLFKTTIKNYSLGIATSYSYDSTTDCVTDYTGSQITLINSSTFINS